MELLCVILAVPGLAAVLAAAVRMENLLLGGLNDGPTADLAAGPTAGPVAGPVAGPAPSDSAGDAVCGDELELLVPDGYGQPADVVLLRAARQQAIEPAPVPMVDWLDAC